MTQDIFLARRHKPVGIRKGKEYPDKHNPFVFNIISKSIAFNKEIE